MLGNDQDTDIKQFIPILFWYIYIIIPSIFYFINFSLY